MKLSLIAGGIAAGTLAVAVPTAIALASPPSFSERVPVRVPAKAAKIVFDDRGHASEAPASTASPAKPVTATPTSTPVSATPTRHAEPGDDNHNNRHGGQGRHGTPSAGATTTHANEHEHGNEAGDDNHNNRHGGHGSTTAAPSATPSATRSSTRSPEAGDDHGGDRNRSGNSGNSGSDDSSHGGHGGHGGDD